MHKLFSSELKVINIGLSAFKQALDDAHAPAVQLDWKPPMNVDAALMERVSAMLPEIEKANAKAVEMIQAGMPHLVGMGRALDVIPGMKPDLLLHAGPPIEWERMCGPMRGAVVGALLYEKRAASADEAERLAASGQIEFAPCHEHNAVGPMAGIVSASMPVFIISNEQYGNLAYCTLNEGLGKVLRYGAFDETVIRRLRWMETVLYPCLKDALAKIGKLDLKNLIAQALQMGDEVHNRNRAATSLFYRAVAPAIVADLSSRRGGRGSPGVHQSQRSLFPESLDAGIEGDAGCGARHREQQRRHRHVAQRHGVRNSAFRHRRKMVHRSRRRARRAILSGILPGRRQSGHRRQRHYGDQQPGRIRHRCLPGDRAVRWRRHGGCASATPGRCMKSRSRRTRPIASHT